MKLSQPPALVLSESYFLHLAATCKGRRYDNTFNAMDESGNVTDLAIPPSESGSEPKVMTVLDLNPFL